MLIKNKRTMLVIGLAVAMITSVTCAKGEHKPAATIITVGAAEGPSITFDRPVEYVAHPDGGVTVRYVEGLKLTRISTATKDRGGAMWNPNAGKQGCASWKPQGFDARMKGKSGGDTYSANTNVAPAATGSPFKVPGAGSLILSIPGDIPTSRIKKVVARYCVVNFADKLPTAGSYRAPTRGMAAPRDHWTQARVHANLDRYFPADRDLLPEFSDEDAARLLDRWGATAAAGIFYTSFASDEISPALGLPWYGRDLSKSLGIALLDLRKRARDEAYRYAMADAIVQYGIDIYGTILDGSYFQMNGGWTHGRVWIVEFAGVMLEDEYMLNMVADPLNKPSAPESTLDVLPFTEQRQYSPVRPKGEYYTRGTRPQVSDQMARWGSVVGADPDQLMALAPEDVGIRYWTVQNDRAYGKRSQLSSWINRAYHSVNIQGQAWVRAAHALLEQDGHAEVIAGTKPIRDGIDTSLQQQWQMHQSSKRIAEQGMIPNPHGFIKGGAGALYADWRRDLGKGIVDINTLHKTKPGRAYAPLLTESGDGTVSVEFNAYMPGHGHPIQRHDIRWSTDGGKNWTVITDAEDGLKIDTGIKREAVIIVQDRLTTSAGTGAWSHTMRVEIHNETKTFGEITIRP